MLTNLAEIYGELERMKNIVTEARSEIISWDVDADTVIHVISSLLNEWETSELSYTYIDFGFNDKSANKFKYIKVLFKNLGLHTFHLRAGLVKPDKVIPLIQELVDEILNAINYVQSSISQSGDMFTNEVLKKQVNYLIEWYEKIKSDLLAFLGYFIEEEKMSLPRANREEIGRFANYLKKFIQYFNLNVQFETVNMFAQQLFIEQSYSEYKQNVDKFIVFIDSVIDRIREKINNT